MFCSYFLGGYEKFREQFPIHCGLFSLDKEVPMPIYIAPGMLGRLTLTLHQGLYLGSRPTGSFERRLEKRLAYERDVLSRLGIGAVIINADASLELEDAHGLKCFLMRVADSNDIKMKDLWNSTIDFISEMHSNNESVLIQFHGRSRSASIAIAWAIKVRIFPNYPNPVSPEDSLLTDAETIFPTCRGVRARPEFLHTRPVSDVPGPAPRLRRRN